MGVGITDDHLDHQQQLPRQPQPPLQPPPPPLQYEQPLPSQLPQPWSQHEHQQHQQQRQHQDPYEFFDQSDHDQGQVFFAFWVHQALDCLVFAFQLGLVWHGR